MPFMGALCGRCPLFDPVRETIIPLPSRERCPAFRIFKTRNPSLPSVIGSQPPFMQLRKCSHSTRSGSACWTSTLFRICLGRDGVAVLPPDFMRVEEQLIRPGAHVIEDSHFSVANDHELLHLERMEPGYKDVRP